MALLVMRSHLGLCPDPEFLLTDVTLVRLLSRVHPNVLRQCPFLGETLSTVFAAEISSPGMNLDMQSQS